MRRSGFRPRHAAKPEKPREADWRSGFCALDSRSRVCREVSPRSSVPGRSSLPSPGHSAPFRSHDWGWTMRSVWGALWLRMGCQRDGRFLLLGLVWASLLPVTLRTLAGGRRRAWAVRGADLTDQGGARPQTSWSFPCPAAIRAGAYSDRGDGAETWIDRGESRLLWRCQFVRRFAGYLSALAGGCRHAVGT